jgi:hypothetical protein
MVREYNLLFVLDAFDPVHVSYATYRNINIRERGSYRIEGDFLGFFFWRLIKLWVV